MSNISKHILYVCGIAVSCIVSRAALAQNNATETVQSEQAVFSVETVGEGFETPWSMAFLSDEKALLGEREVGRLTLLSISTGRKVFVAGLPEMLRSSERSSGLFDVKVHPDFDENSWVYLAYGIGAETANGLGVSRCRLEDVSLIGCEKLYEADAKIDGKWHFGGRLVLNNGYLFISTGDGYDFSALAQDLASPAGKILRLHDDGRVPGDNPFVDQDGALPEIWSYGVRNPQGMALNRRTGEVWHNEHGPQGGDEVNISRAGVNYGWPIITYGEEYGGGAIGDGITHQNGMAQPTYYWVPSIAPSGMTFYSGDQFAGWRTSAFVGALAKTHINRLVIEENSVIHEERLLADKGWRVRFVEEGPDGYLYFGVDDGLIMRLVPAGE